MPDSFHSATSAFVCTSGSSPGRMPSASLHEKPVAVEAVDALAGLLLGQPPSFISAISKSPMPMPAEPDPNMAMVCSFSGRPVARTAASSVPVVMAAVP